MTDSNVLLITGASSGIGAATARHAVDAGWRVVLAARSEDKLAALAQDLGGDDVATAIRCDVTSWDDQQGAVSAAIERFGRLDAFLANAGFGAARGFQEESVEHWKAMIDTNVYGAALSIRAALGPFREQGSGHMLLMGSVAGTPRDAGLALLRDEVGRHGHGREPARRGGRHRHQDHGDRAGHGGHPVLRQPPTGALEADDIARAVMYALSQPAHVDVNEVLVRPVNQPT